MNRFLPPACLVLAVGMLVAGFALWNVEAPRPSVELHRASASGDEQYRDALQAQLHREQRKRKTLLVALFVGSGVFLLTAFLTMQPAEEEHS
jgi:hypothetical protein